MLAVLIVMAVAAAIGLSVAEEWVREHYQHRRVTLVTARERKPRH